VIHNGARVVGKVTLAHGDRVVFTPSHMYAVWLATWPLLQLLLSWPCRFNRSPPCYRGTHAVVGPICVRFYHPPSAMLS